MNENFFDALTQVNFDKPDKVIFLLYYDKESGMPLFYTTDKQENGTYIEVDKDVYAKGRYDIQIIDKKILTPSNDQYYILSKSNSGTGCHPDNVMIIDQNSDVKWKKTKC